MKVFTAIVSLAALVAAAPHPQSVSQCNTGTISCCNNVQSSSSSLSQTLAGLLGLGLGSLGAQIGLGCTPISVIGVGSGVQCSSQPVCCTGNSFGGLLSLGCNSLNLL